MTCQKIKVYKKNDLLEQKVTETVHMHKVWSKIDLNPPNKVRGPEQHLAFLYKWQAETT